MRKTVLDASAILAALFRELGPGVIETHYEAGVVSSVNLSEAAAKFSDRGMTLHHTGPVDKEIEATA